MLKFSFTGSREIANCQVPKKIGKKFVIVAITLKLPSDSRISQLAYVGHKCKHGYSMIIFSLDRTSSVQTM